MADTNKSLHLKNLARDTVAADPANPYKDWSPPTIARAAKTASSPATSPSDSSPLSGSGERFNQIDKAFSSAGSGDPFSSDDIFDAEDTSSVDPFLAYSRQGGNQGTGATPNSSSKAGAQPESVFAEEMDEDVADSIFASTAPGSASRTEEQRARILDSFPPSPQRQEDGLIDSSASGNGDGTGEGEEGLLASSPQQNPLPIEEDEAEPADAEWPKTAATPNTGNQTFGEKTPADPAPPAETGGFSQPAPLTAAPAASAPHDWADAPDTGAEAPGEKTPADPEPPAETGGFSQPAPLTAAPAASAPHDWADAPDTGAEAPGEKTPADPAPPVETGSFSRPAPLTETPAPAAAPEPTAAATLTLDPDSAAETHYDPTSVKGTEGATTAASESIGHYEPLPPAEPGGFHAEALPELQVLSASAPEETAEEVADASGDWDGMAQTALDQTALEESGAFDAFFQDSDLSVDFSEELDTLKTQVDHLITSYNQVYKENSDLKRQRAEAEESVRRYAEDCQQLRVENEQLKPLRALNRELQEEVADAQREKRPLRRHGAQYPQQESRGRLSHAQDDRPPRRHRTLLLKSSSIPPRPPAMSTDKDKRITVGIMIAKKEYHFSTTEENHGMLIEAAEMVDERICEQQSSSADALSISNERLAIATAVNLASDLINMRRGTDSAAATLEELRNDRQSLGVSIRQLRNEVEGALKVSDKGKP